MSAHAAEELCSIVTRDARPELVVWCACGACVSSLHGLSELIDEVRANGWGTHGEDLVCVECQGGTPEAAAEPLRPGPPQALVAMPWIDMAELEGRSTGGAFPPVPALDLPRLYEVEGLAGPWQWLVGRVYVACGHLESAGGDVIVARLYDNAVAEEASSWQVVFPASPEWWWVARSRWETASTVGVAVHDECQWERDRAGNLAFCSPSGHQLTLALQGWQKLYLWVCSRAVSLPAPGEGDTCTP